MTRKTSKAYSAVFEFVEERIFVMDPAMFMTDFEEGMRSAIKQRWPDVDINGCWFHYKRAVSRNISSLGMKKLLDRNFNARMLKRMFLNLPLLPENQTLEGYECIWKFANKKKLNESFANVFTYFQYWLNQVDKYIYLYIRD